MKRVFSLLLAVFLLMLPLTACTTQENPPETHIVHNGQLWKVPTETVGIALPEDAELIDCTRIPLEVLPSRENECNYTHGTIQVYDGDGFFLVIIDGKQHRIELDGPAETELMTQSSPDGVFIVHNGQLCEVEDYPDMTTACVLEEDELIKGIVIPADHMPAKEGEVNVNANDVKIWDYNDSYFILIIDGTQYIVDYP